MATIFLLDIDGVLVKPGGYRTALHRTIAYFLEQLGLPSHFNLTEDEIGIFEANGITSEWDMIPLTFATIFDSALSSYKIRLPSLQHAINWFRITNPLVDRPIHTANIPKWLESSTPGLPLADSLYARFLENPPNQPFPNLANQPFVVEILANTRDFSKNAFSRVFQNHVLGEDIFKQHYPGLPVFPVESTLENYDKPNLHSELQLELRKEIENGRIHAAAMTLRPNRLSGMSLNGNPYRAGFSPEAEIALRLTGVEGIALAGYGTLLWACQRYQLAIDQVLKPSEFHALLAIGLALNQPVDALQFCMSLYQDNSSSEQINLFTNLSKYLPNETLNIHIFEDSPNGLRSVRRASEILNKAGWPVILHLWGITDHPHKKQALEELGARVFSSTSEALKTALKLTSG
ncbi:MAG: hypothetical protein KatS3mg047_0524 [Bellilinea sp.]|nr:MAG: hypothetical protein KatS3mg047_0524 [Bellilinea sp.]